MQDQVRAAVVGAGSIGAGMDRPDAPVPLTHAGGYAATGFSLVAFVDTDPAARSHGKQWGCPVFADFDEMMRVNVKSALYGMQVVLPHFKARGSGHIVNVSSMLGRVPFAPFRSAYSAAKHALNALTASLRLELRDAFPGIHVSTVSPGVVATDFGLAALGGGPDSRALAMAQPAAEVAEVIAGIIEAPRADVYTRPGMREMVVRYFAAEDMAAAEAAPPFAPTRP